MIHQSFQSTTRGLRRDSPPMRLFEKAKRLGTWNPSDIDFSQDISDWQRLSAQERDLILRLTALFQAGEEAVTLDLLPLIATIAREGRIEEELYLTTFLWEEAKHTDFFRRFLDDVVQTDDDLSHYHTPSYRALIYDELPRTLHRLERDPSPLAQAEAALTYNLIVEGVLAETGYHAYFTMLERNNVMPGQRQGIKLLKQDESRHIAYGIYLLSRLIAEDPPIWDAIEQRMNELMLLPLTIITEAFDCYERVPFGLTLDEFTSYALGQFQRRIERIERARTTGQIVLEEDEATV